MIQEGGTGAQGPELSAAELEAKMRSVLSGCVENLLTVYSADEGLFPYSSRIDHGSFANDYRRPDSLRYTINTLLGLSRAARAGIPGVSIGEVNEMVETFTARHGTGIESHADLGLLILLLTDSTAGVADSAVQSAVETLRRSLAVQPPEAFHMQDLGWMIWGAAAATRSGFPGADELGRSATALVKAHFVDRSSGLPRHSTKRYRRNLVSFGSLVYFLRAMYEAGRTFEDEEAATLFADGVRRTISIQGPLGEWPWMIHVRVGKPVDVYPVFSVHQDSMAMLFLLPALEAGDPRTMEAIRRSVSWVFGRNELGVRFYREAPFFAYRSIERAEPAPRLRRYVRYLSFSITRRAGTFGGARTRLNDECRSYHLGWILFAWSERLAATAAAEAGDANAS